MDWQPIETAPKDGTEVYIRVPSGPLGDVWTEGSFVDGHWQSDGVRWNPDYQPTHWVPMSDFLRGYRAGVVA